MSALSTETYSVELTIDELEAMLAEQLPARELMGGRGGGHKGCGCGGGDVEQSNEFEQNGLINVNLINVQVNNYED